MLVVEQIANPRVDQSKHRSFWQVHVLWMIIEDR
jgi:fatty-acid desaturase